MDNASCIIVGVEATDARPSGEISSARKMIAECGTKLGLTPRTLAADTGYGKAEFLAWLESQDIASYIPLREHFASTSGNKLFSLDRFTYRPESNSFECPEGKQLKYIGIKPAVNKSYIYRSTEAKCRECPVKSECTSGRYKQIVIHVEEAVRQRARDRTRKAAFFQHQRSRRKIEALFGELKNRIGLRRVRLRRLKHVREQFLMAAAAQNLKRLVRYLASGRTGNDTDNPTHEQRSKHSGNKALAPSRYGLFQQLHIDGVEKGRIPQELITVCNGSGEVPVVLPVLHQVVLGHFKSRSVRIDRILPIQQEGVGHVRAMLQ